MDLELKLPPRRKEDLTAADQLAVKLTPLLGNAFDLTGKSRTDGSNLRKLIASTLHSNNPPAPANKDSFEVIPSKGVPKILLEYVDTYIATSGSTYNLQVWNRNPSAESVQVEYSNGDTMQSGEVRFVLVKIDPTAKIITAIAVLTPEYVVEKFGAFGKPTEKYQLIISKTARDNVLSKPDGILFYDDDLNGSAASNINNLPNLSLHDEPSNESLLPLATIKDIIKDNILGQKIEPAATKNRGQKLESMLATALGYTINDGELLAGGYPDIRNQALEIKIQDSATVDFGMYTPEFETVISDCSGFTTRTMRYFIALTNPSTHIIEGAVLCSGSKLGLHFTYVGEKSYKCQRSIPMTFFSDIEGQSVFNP